MADITANRPIPNILMAHPYAGGGYVIDAPVGALEEIYQGAFVTLDSGDKFLGNLTVPDAMYGLALERVTGGAANGDVTAKVLCQGVIQHAITSIAVASIGKPVYATDNQTLTITNDGTDTPIGRLVGVPVTGTAIVQMYAPRVEKTGTFALTNFTADYSLDVAGTVVIEASECLGALIDELIKQGIVEGTLAA